MIEAVNVSLSYRDGTLALKDVNLKVNPGELVYIVGPSGSGKTSLLKLFLGIEYPTSGSLNVLNQPIKKGASGKIRRMRREIGPVFQEFKLIEGRTALENVMMGIRFLGIPLKHMKEEASNALERVGLSNKTLSKVENLSWGQCQRVAIARAIARKPKLILADEPTGNLDHENALNILELLTSFKEKDTAVIITTHATHLIQNERNVTFIHVKEGNISIERRGEL
ncbi:cell division ATP-binding protein FtsE [Clostridium homopropionicum DSM 5847]|uniref:Cell division ATP-binding protein FtsE n=1 Tax=Clostridium homopropionicum DSM 5847 TaxID=1121318 RepID=A0A0L6Z7D0_9CLOT|nr:ABC transporter ATP-binding protein [Clostridium homopropionicum]KOA18698.1 cell division ATP-binding protein FtsE [Clostridium homopropionicum DSM 5847]SFG53061.1 cell division transport system ATP-binding protein [Clostridium homopropionicum]